MGEVTNLGTLSARANDEHRAVQLALTDALEHALEAGRVLDEVKTSLPHTAFGPWLAANFAGSDRTARDYLRLHRNREKLLPKRQRSAVLSIAGALRALKTLAPPSAPDPALGLPKPPPGVYPDPEVLRGLEQEEAATEALRQHNREALAGLRAAERAGELRGIVVALDGLVRGYRPEEAGTELARITGGGRALAVLREALPWLQRVLEEAEAARDHRLASGEEQES